MARTCPLCPSQALSPIRASDVSIDVCPRCQGVWLDSGELKHFPNHAALRPYLASARQAPSRCRKQGHQVPRALVACATCNSAPVSCPACGSRLSLVATSACVIDVCAQCDGVWLDAGELEQLRNVVPPQPAVRASSARKAAASEWEVPQAAEPVADPWKSSGSHRPLHGASSPFGCNHCGLTVMAHRAYAYDGEVYCEDCKPAGAVSGAKAPKDKPLSLQGFEAEGDVGFRFVSWFITLFR